MFAAHRHARERIVKLAIAQVCLEFLKRALYLRTVVTDVTDAAVTSDHATIHTADGEDVEVALTQAVAGFVLAFDLGAYPALIDTATDDNGDVIDDLDR